MPNPVNFGALKVGADYSFMDDVQDYINYVIALIAENQALYAQLNGNVSGALGQNDLNVLSVNGSLLQDVPEQAGFRSITVIVYVDGEQIFETSVTSQEPIRMPANEKGYVYEVRISGNTPVSSVIMASSISELRQVAP